MGGVRSIIQGPSTLFHEIRVRMKEHTPQQSGTPRDNSFSLIHRFGSISEGLGLPPRRATGLGPMHHGIQRKDMECISKVTNYAYGKIIFY